MPIPGTMIGDILSGKYDDMLDNIIGYCNQRKEALTVTMSPGTIVRFSDEVRPTYLRNVRCRFVGRKQRNIVVEPLPGQYTGRYHGKITCPPEYVTPI